MVSRLGFLFGHPAYIAYNLVRPLLPWDFLSPLRKFFAGFFVRFGSGVWIGTGIHFGESGVSIGAYTTINPNVRIGVDTVIGEKAIVSEGCVLNPAEHDLLERSRYFSKSLRVGNNVFFGANAIVLGGAAEIGDNAVIGAGAVVTKPVPRNAVVAGNPAKVVRMLAPSGGLEL